MLQRLCLALAALVLFSSPLCPNHNWQQLQEQAQALIVPYLLGGLALFLALFLLVFWHYRRYRSGSQPAEKQAIECTEPPDDLPPALVGAVVAFIGAVVAVGIAGPLGMWPVAFLSADIALADCAVYVLWLIFSPLSSENPANNPLSYQRGSVWPHDTLLAAAGLWRYGHYEQVGTLIRAILEAATACEETRLPELFCGLPREHDLPVPYAQANIPQAWAAAAPVMAAQLFLGLLPDAPHGRCFVSPWLPEWLPRLELHGITMGRGSLDITVARRGTETVIEELERKEIEVIEGMVEAPLWGKPPLESEPGYAFVKEKGVQQDESRDT